MAQSVTARYYCGLGMFGVRVCEFESSSGLAILTEVSPEVFLSYIRQILGWYVEIRLWPTTFHPLAPPLSQPVPLILEGHK